MLLSFRFEHSRSVMLALGALLCMPALARGADLTVALFVSPLGEVQKQVVIEPFKRATKLDVAVAGRDLGVGAVRTMVEGGNNIWDVVTAENVETLQGCEEGYFVKIDKSKLPDLKDFDTLAEDIECGVPFVFYGAALGYNKKTLKEEPKSWADFWDTAKWPGKRSMNRRAQDTLEIALLADGVPRDDVYKVLETPAGVGRAFRKLDQLKSNIVWWSNPGQSRQLLASGEVVMTATYDNGIRFFNKTQGTDFGVVAKDAITHVNYFAIVVNTRHNDNAYIFMNFASKPDSQAAVANGLAISVPNRKALAFVDKDLQPYLSNTSENLKDTLKSDARFWLNNHDDLQRRFDAWLSRP
jgi:putative spermidine/putrescine transport system substrate-binding protein